MKNIIKIAMFVVLAGCSVEAQDNSVSRETGAWVVSRFEGESMKECWVTADKPLRADGVVSWHNAKGQLLAMDNVLIGPPAVEEKVFGGEFYAGCHR